MRVCLQGHATEVKTKQKEKRTSQMWIKLFNKQCLYTMKLVLSEIVYDKNENIRNDAANEEMF